MNPIAHMLAPPKPPKWRGPALVHTLDNRTPANDPSKTPSRPWQPWSLLTPSMTLRPAFKRAAGCWGLLS